MKCRDGGMVDTRDLKSLGHCVRVGSSPIPCTNSNSITSHKNSDRIVDNDWKMHMKIIWTMTEKV